MTVSSNPPGELHDNSLIWFGQHKGKALVNVPAQYLLYLYNAKLGSRFPNDRTDPMWRYLVRNLDVLHTEANKNKRP